MIRNAEAAMVPRLKELWLHCFSDSMEDINYFFEHRFKEEESLVMMAEEVPAAMMFLLPAAVAGSGQEASYIYAFATHPNFRGRGIATRLLAAAIERSQKEGRLVFLCPADKELEGFYAKRGFYPSFSAGIIEGEMPQNRLWQKTNANYVHNAEIRNSAKNEFFTQRFESACCLSQSFLWQKTNANCVHNAEIGSSMTEETASWLYLEDCTPAEYVKIRAAYIKKMDIAWDERAVKYALEENAHSGGICKKILLPDGGQSAVLAGIRSKCLLLRELFLPENKIKYLPELLWRLAECLNQAEQAPQTFHAVLPKLPKQLPNGMAWRGSQQLIGMSDNPNLHGYLNLVLD